MGAGELVSGVDIGPTIRRLIKPQMGEAQILAIMRIEYARELLECDGSQILDGRDAIEHNRFVVYERC